MTLLIDVTKLRFIRTSDEFQALSRARLFETITTSLEIGEPEFAKALAATAIERSLTSASVLEYSPAEVERLRALVAEADAAMIRRPATSATTSATTAATTSETTSAPEAGGAEPE